MKYPRDLTGIKFNRLTVLEKTVKPSNLKREESYWLCKCDCGNTTVAGRNRLVTNHTTSCGCARKEFIGSVNRSHGLGDTRFYSIWLNMVQRCSNSNNPNYKHYGGRGIVLENGWDNFNNFKNDMFSSYTLSVELSGEKNTTLERKDVNGNYSAKNCKWVSMMEQAKNKRDNIKIEVDGVDYKCLSDVAREYNINNETLRCRYIVGDRGKELIRPVK